MLSQQRRDSIGSQSGLVVPSQSRNIVRQFPRSADRIWIDRELEIAVQLRRRMRRGILSTRLATDSRRRVRERERDHEGGVISFTAGRLRLVSCLPSFCWHHRVGLLGSKVWRR